MTFIEATSAAMPEPIRPATSRLVKTGPISRKIESDDDAGNIKSAAEAGESVSELQRHDRTRGQSGNGSQRERANADVVELFGHEVESRKEGEQAQPRRRDKGRRYRP